MASPVEEVPVETLSPTADVVGNAFVHQYYHILHKSPELVHRFYQDKSSLSRTEENGMMSITTSMEAINEKILSLDYGNLRSEITAVDAQDSFSGGVFVLVNGFMIWRDNSRKYFAQSFFLAPQDTGYYVLNDVFRYVDDIGYENGDQALVNYDEEPRAIESDCLVLPEVHTPEIAVVNADETAEEKLSEPENREELVAEEEAPTSEVLEVEMPDDSQLVEHKPKTEEAPECKFKTEEAPKKSYASILGTQHVKVKATQKNVVPLSAPLSAPAKTEPKNQEQVVAAPTLVPVVETVPTPNPNVSENGDIQEVEEGYSIYIKGLPSNATNAIVEAEFKKFGAIKSNGVQVRFNRGFGFGFVEFEAASSARSALEASPILMSGRQVVVEEKRSTLRGTGRGRFAAGRGNNGYRNDGATRGRFHGGGRGYGRYDFNGGGDFGNRNGNGDCNARGDLRDRNGNSRVGPRHENNGRAHRGSGFGDSVHGTGRSSAIRVSVTA